MEIPKLIKIRQHFNPQRIDDVEGEVYRQISQSEISVEKGAHIAVAVGSRGIRNMHRVVKALVEWLKEKGAAPFIVPAMGSHGGASAEGQKQVLASYGITEEAMGVPIRSSMRVVELPQGDLVNRVFMDSFAYEADGIIVVNRIKPHTDFHGDFESGLIKMCVIGLGKHRQALEIHRYRVHGLKNLILPSARQVLKQNKVILGIGLVENAYDQTMRIEAILPKDFEKEERKLLDLARENMPRLPVDQLDVLVVDQMGKDLSGVGIDTNIIGRMKISGEMEPTVPSITNIVVSDLTEASHGNALGMGLADITTRRLFEKIDFKATYENVLTSTFLERGKLPIVAETDGQAVQYALRTCGPISIQEAKIVRVRSTLHLEEVYVSSSVLEEMRGREDLEIIGEFKDWLDETGNLTEF